jgi:hypothetical protein
MLVRQAPLAPCPSAVPPCGFDIMECGSEETDEQGMPNMSIQMGNRSTYIYANTFEEEGSR